MIVIEARLKCNPGKRDEFLKEVQPIIATTRKEDGCLCYELFISTEDKDGLLFFERWVSRDALKKHTESPHMTEWIKRRADTGIMSVPAKVTVYDVAE